MVAQAHCESARASQIMIRFKNNDSLANRTSLEEGRERKITATITTWSSPHSPNTLVQKTTASSISDRIREVVPPSVWKGTVFISVFKPSGSGSVSDAIFSSSSPGEWRAAGPPLTSTRAGRVSSADSHAWQRSISFGGLIWGR